MAHGVCDAAEIFGVPLFGMTGTLHEEIYQARGIPFVAEFYADLEYNAEGKLILTRVHDAKDPAKMAERCVRAITKARARPKTERFSRFAAKRSACIRTPRTPSISHGP